MPRSISRTARSHPVTKFRIAPVNLRLSEASLDLSRPLPITLDAVINDHARFTAKGSLTPEPLAAALDIKLAKARMTDPAAVRAAAGRPDHHRRRARRCRPRRARAAGRRRPRAQLRRRRGHRSLHVGRQRVAAGPRQLRPARAGQAALRDGAGLARHRPRRRPATVCAGDHQPRAGDQHRCGARPAGYRQGPGGAPRSGGGRGGADARPSAAASSANRRRQKRRPPGRRRRRPRHARPAVHRRRRQPSLRRPTRSRSASARCASTTGA